MEFEKADNAGGGGPSLIVQRLIFGVGSLGTGIFAVVPSILLLYYLTTRVHVAPGLAGLLIVAPKLVSILTDPIVGHYSDHVKSRGEGNRRRLMFVGSLASGAGLWAVFSLPDRFGSGGWLAALLYLAYVLGFSTFAVPYMSLPADIESSPARRQALVATRIAVSFIGGLVGAVAAPMIVGLAGYGVMGIVLGSISLAATATCTLFYRRGATPTCKPADASLFTVSAIRLALSETTYLRLISGFILFVIASACVSAGLPFLVQGEYKQPAAVLSEAFLLNAGSGLVGTVVWPTVLTRFGQAFAWRSSAALMVVGVCLLAFAGAVNASFVCGLIVGGFGFGGVEVIGFVALADLASRIEASGRAGSGMVTGLWIAGEKLGFALGPLLVGIVIQAATLPGASMRAVLTIAIGILPSILSVIAGAILWSSGSERKKSHPGEPALL